MGVFAQSVSIAEPIFGYTTYENSSLGIRMQYPSNWTAVDPVYDPPGYQEIAFEYSHNSGIPAGTFDPYAVFFSIELHEPEAGHPLSIGMGEDYTVVTTIVDGIPAFELESKGTSSTTKLGTFASYTMNIYVVKDDRVNLIRYLGYDPGYFLNMPMIQRVIDSITFM